MSSNHQYKCPNCNGAIAFDTISQKVTCEYCGTEFEMEALESYDAVLKSDSGDDIRWDSLPDEAWTTDEETGLRTYTCKSCGGEIIGDENMATTDCPFCGNHTIIMSQFAGNLRPDVVIPFKLDKKAAVRALENHYCNKRLLPQAFKEKNHIEEIKGVYVPYWIFDAEASASVRYRAENTTVWEDSEWIYTKHDWFIVQREGSLGFSHVPVDGSSKMPDDLMESIEPFDFADAVDFQTAYLSGYLTDKYDVESDDCLTRAAERMRTSAERAFASTVVGYQSVVPESASVRTSSGNAIYALYPVWMLKTKWNGQDYTFAMNGQTGKFVGDLPLDERQYKSWLVRLSALCGGICALLLAGLWAI